MSKYYEMKRECADPFDLMCSDCPVTYIEYWERVTLDELKEDHSYLVIADKYIPEQHIDCMKEEFDWQPTPEDFDEWLHKSIEDGYIRIVEA